MPKQLQSVQEKILFHSCSLESQTSYNIFYGFIRYLSVSTREWSYQHLHIFLWLVYFLKVLMTRNSLQFPLFWQKYFELLVNVIAGKQTSLKVAIFVYKFGKWKIFTSIKFLMSYGLEPQIILIVFTNRREVCVSGLFE